MNANLYKFEYSEPGSFYFGYGHGNMVDDHTSEIDEYSKTLENPTTMVEEQTAEYAQPEVNSSSTVHTNPVVECKFQFV